MQILMNKKSRFPPSLTHDNSTIQSCVQLIGYLAGEREDVIGRDNDGVSFNSDGCFILVTVFAVRITLYKDKRCTDIMKGQRGGQPPLRRGAREGP